MFTGIITDVGQVKSCHDDGGVRLGIFTNYDTETIPIGASVSCSGICLTVVEKSSNVLFFDVSKETLAKSNVGEWSEGDHVNLERPLKVGDELGGHIISGHVDCVSDIIDIQKDGTSSRFYISMPAGIKKFIAEKGSITLDGTSLTVNGVGEDQFDVNLVPHTQVMTSFQYKNIGDTINVEVDILARYLARMNATGV